MSSKLTFVPPERALSVSGDFTQLIAFIRAGEWDRGDLDAVALHALFTGGWHVFEPGVLAARTRQFFKLPAKMQTQENFQFIFGIHQHRALPTTDRSTQPASPAVVLTPGGMFDGAWISITSIQQPAQPSVRGESLPRTFSPTLASPPVPAVGNSTRRGGRGMTAPSPSDLPPKRGTAALSTTRRGRRRAPAPKPLHRTPHMVFSTEPPFAPLTEFVVEVFADDKAPLPGEETEGITLPGTEEEYEIIVWLAPSAELTVVGGNLQPLVIRPGEARSTSAKFHVRVARLAKAGKLAALTASFSYQGRPCGRITRTLLIGKAGTKGDAHAKKSGREFAGLVFIEAEAPPLPDLTVVVTCPDGDADRYVVKVSSPHLDEFKNGVAFPWKLRQAAGKFVGTMLANFVEEGITHLQRLDNLVGAGRKFFKASPQHFQDAFWELVRKQALRSIYIVSEEPHIPWELMVPVPVPQSSDDDGRKWRPLGVEYAMGRWVHAGHVSPPGSVTLSSAFILAPDYTGTSQSVLAKAKSEAAFVRRHFGGTPFTPVTYTAIRNRICTELTSLFHFVGHGAVTEAGDDEQIYLEADQTLSTTQVEGIDGFAEGFRKTRPLVFFNACEVGRAVPALVGSGGFPRTFVTLGASAVIAPLWSVEDNCAHEVAATIYQAVKDDAQSGARPRPVAAILQTLRARTYASGADEGKDSFAAYCFYGDPSFVLKLS